MEKPIYQSKTMWGFGITALLLLGQTLGVVEQSQLMTSLQVISGLFGFYGLRSAQK